MKTFFGSLLGTLVAIFLCVGGVLLLFLLIFALAASRSRPLPIQNNSLAVLDLSAPITDTPPEPNLADVLSDTPRARETAITLRELLSGINNAATDNRIAGIFITGNIMPIGYSSGFAALKEVREALIQFKKSGKPVYAYLLVPTTRTYYLASVADRIFIDPQGVLAVHGMATERLYLAGALQKYGIGVQVTRVGKYKSAVEPFINDKMSPADREQTQTLIGDMWSEISSAIEQSRKMAPGSLQTMLQNGLIEPQAAVKAGLGTDLVSRTQVVAELQKKYGSDSDRNTFRQVAFDRYVGLLVPGRGKPSGPKIAIVYAEGDIVDGEGQSGDIGGDKLARAIHTLDADSSVKAMVLRVNSPGGSALASEVIRRELAEFATSRPLVVSMGTVAASGGYWITTAASHVFAEPTTITGSIGVFGLLFNVQKLANDNGVTFDAVTTTPFDLLGTISRPQNPTELGIIQKVVDRIYNDFLERVSSARKISQEQVNEIAQGRVWAGSSALKLKLVDEIGGLREAIAYTGKQVGLGEQPALVEYPVRKDLSAKLKEIIRGRERPPVTKTDSVTRGLEELKADLESFRNFNDPENVYARLPIGIRWN
jgi:protease-4